MQMVTCNRTKVNHSILHEPAQGGGCRDMCPRKTLVSTSSMAEKFPSVVQRRNFECVQKDVDIKLHIRRGGLDISYNHKHVVDDEDDYRDSAYLCQKDIRTQSITYERLDLCGWYYGKMSSPEAKKLLSKVSSGTFIIRDSSDSKYLYSVSVKTSRGTTSVRIIYHKGYFQLDCEERVRSKMPKFDCVVRLVDFYVRLSISDRNHICRWLESNGRKDLPILLKKPKVNSVLDLKHMCRLTVNRSYPATTDITKVHRFTDSLLIPTSIKTYLKDHPFLN